MKWCTVKEDLEIACIHYRSPTDNFEADDLTDNKLKINGNVGKLDVDIILEFTESDSEGILANLSVQSKEITLDIGCYFSGYNISQFVNELSTLKKSLQGLATLITLNEEIEIIFKVIDEKRGYIGADIRLDCPIFPDEIEQYSKLQTFGYKIDICGISFDQSYLDQIILDIKELIRSFNLPSQHPFELRGQ